MTRRRISRRRNDSNLAESLEARALLTTITVTSLGDVSADDGQVTLREAIEAANTDTSVDGSEAGDGADTIVFDPSLDETTIRLDDQVEITESLAIVGSGVHNTHIRGQRGDRLLTVPDSASDVDLSVEGVFFTRNSIAIDHQGSGGSLAVRYSRFKANRQAIRSEVDVLVRNSTFRENSTKRPGAAIGVEGQTDAPVTVDIARSEFTDNETTDREAHGGAVSVRNTNLQISESVFLRNETTRSRSNGGAVSAYFSNVEITNSTFTENVSYLYGGAIYLNESDGTVENTTVANNMTRFGSGIGGGIRLLGDTQTRTLNLVNSAVAGNTLGGGTAEDIGVLNGNVIASHSFVSSNRTSGLQSNAGNADANGNLIGNTSSPLDAQLGALQDNGGATLSMLPEAGSPLLDAGGTTLARIDQRGQPRQGGDQIDIGATEFSDVGFEITPNQLVVSEADQNLTVTFDVTLKSALTEPIDVRIESKDITAVAGTDFTAVDTTLTFDGTIGQTQQFSVTILDDSDLELRESFGFDYSTDGTDTVAAFTPVSVSINSDETSGIGLTGDTLLIFGDASNDVVTIAPDGDNIVATLNGTSESFAAAEIGVLQVELGDGNNSLVVDDTLTVPVEFTSGQGADTVTTAGGDDSILTGGGDDVITTAAGADSVNSGTGSDLVTTGNGNDLVEAGHDNDTVDGGDGDDILLGQQGHDLIMGAGGKDTLQGGGSSDTVIGGAGDDWIAGFAMPQNIDGSDGEDRGDSIEGGDGNDTILAGTGLDRVFGGSGDDTIETAGPGVLRGEDGNDRLTATGEGAKLEGGDGLDTLIGGAGNDTLLGNAGRDSIVGNDGDDSIDGGVSADSIRGGDGNDSIIGGLGADSIDGDRDSDTIRGGGGADILDGGNDNDFLFGEDGDDTLDGASGHDVLSGDAGNDQLNGDFNNVLEKDILIGGTGTDSLTGGGTSNSEPMQQGDTDLIISGSATLTLADLTLVQAEWSSDRDVNVRRANLKDGTGSTDRVNGDVFLSSDTGTGQNIFDDGEIDTVNGGHGRDWFFANLEQDITDFDFLD